MKTAYGKITLFAFLILIGVLLFSPMRAGEEDSMIIDPGILKMYPGDSYRLRCGISSDNPNQTVSFTTADDRIAAVGPDGTVYAYTPGEAVITAHASDGASARMQVIVLGTPMRTLTLNTEELRLKKGEISGLTANYDRDATDTRLQWISDDESVAKVSANGRILGVGGGTTAVSVLSSDGMFASARVVVEVASTAANIMPNEMTVGVGAKVALKVDYLPSDSTDTVRRWSSSDASIAYVDDQSVLHAVGTGRAYINALTRDGISAGMEVTVESAPRDLQLSPAQATIERGQEMDMQLLYLNADGRLDDTVEHLVVWKSSNPDVAQVDQNGHVTALRGGMTRITADSDGYTAESRLRVAVSVHELKLSENERYLLKEQTESPIRLTCKIDPADADDPTVHFACDNNKVARVSDDGVVTLTGGYGTAVITAWNVSGAMDTFTVHVVTQLPEAEAPQTEAPKTEAAEPKTEAVTASQTETAADGGAADEPPVSGAFGGAEPNGANAAFPAAGAFGDGGATPPPYTQTEAEEYTGENIYG